MLDPYFFKEAFLYGGTPEGGDTLILSNIRRLGLFFGVQNSEFEYVWVFQKNEYFFGYYEDFVNILGGWGGVITKLGKF